MRITVTAPHGLEIVADVNPGELGSEGVETTIRQLTDAYERCVAVDIAAGLAAPYLLPEEEGE